MAAFDPGDVDRLFLYVAGFLVFIMNLGFGMQEKCIVSNGSIRNGMLKNFMNTCTTIVVYWAFGYMFAFGGDSNPNCEGCNGFIGVENPFLIGLTDKLFLFWFFEMCFACGAAATFCGSIAERVHWQGFVIHSMIIAGFLYPVVSHWVWSNHGWLSITAPVDVALWGRGVMDFAGDGVVHMTGGVAAFVACYMSGCRNHFVTEEERNKYCTNQNYNLYLPKFQYKPLKKKWKVNALLVDDPIAEPLGIYMLWFGWFGFNGGSILLFNGYSGLVGRVVLNSLIGSGMGGITALVVGRFTHARDRYNPIDVANGIIVGLVSMTGGCAFVHPWAAVCMGTIGSLFFQFVCAVFLHPKVRIDDPSSAAQMHCFCAFWGLLAPGFFAVPHFLDQVAQSPQRGGGIFYGYGLNLIIQLVFGACVFVWSCSATLIVFGIMWAIDKEFKKRNWNTIFFITKAEDIGLGPNKYQRKKLLDYPMDLKKTIIIGDIREQFNNTEIYLGDDLADD